MELLSLFPHPIIQGPTAGGANTPAQVAAVSNAGALGSLAGSLLTPDTLRAQVDAIRALTKAPFLLNFFVQNTPSPSADELARAVELLKPVWTELGWDALPMPAKWCEDFAAQFEALLALRPAVASFTFDQLNAVQVARLHEAGIAVAGTVTTVDEALAWQAVGADAVIASGVEAGGHRGTFIGAQTDATLAAAELLPAVVAAVKIPVVAAGGIMDGADINRMLALGARAVQMGTAFLVTDESAIHPAYKRRLLTAGDQPTRQTRAISGRYARGLENRFIRELAAVQEQVPAYPVQNALTGAIRAEAAKRGDTEWMSLWCGTGVGRARAMPAAALVETLLREMRAG
ncbi:NAD(P)H-dependent flavin oxidoreductase [Pseudoduganella namucuonensis]|uniref:Nitronate monooxygenase n=1 Tax=Pseudoduganella namucuonensis TaxID=1035707 RepID=A0A1I7G8B4_9BURK|nr:nitronate monooxygenase [Pseudoduganella namucuonensis]SFU44591.1 nitronate monooxygenase [Pseudoduganella namucuonensis]